MAERIVEANGIELCTEAFGDPADPPILLVMGIGTSMLWWDEEFCHMLADRGRQVIRYDHRDTGRSVTYEPGHPGYTGGDLVADAAGVLDAYRIDSGHVVGVSAGAAFAQLMAIDYAERVRTLVLISTSPALSVDRELPPPTDEFMHFVSEMSVDWSVAESVVEYQVGYAACSPGAIARSTRRRPASSFAETSRGRWTSPRCRITTRSPTMEGRGPRCRPSAHRRW